ncbi:hypothetical protein EDD92_9616 [Streptomyces sp. TLI_185]|nr:hypothetical protein EDD92_9616 [Streptomyces sp. TLI_185]
MNSVPQHLHSEDRQDFEQILDEALRSTLPRPEQAPSGSAANPGERRRPTPSTRESNPRSASADHHRRAGLGPRPAAATVRAERPGGRRISNGVAARRWAGMSYGRRLLAAVFGLHVRPDVPKTAGAAEESTPPPETTEAAGSSAFAVFAAPATVLSGAITAICFLAGLVLKMFSSGKASARPMFSAGWVFGSVTVGLIIICMIVQLVTTLRKRPSPHAEPYGEKTPRPPTARVSGSDAVGAQLNREQLRTMALNATALITVAAAAEYQHYVKVREELRQPAPSTPPSTRGPGSAGEPAAGIATTLGEAAGAGAGLGAVAAVVTPVLAGTAAAIFLLVGYIVGLQSMITAGWVFAAVTAAAIVVAVVGLLLTALRTQSSLESGPYGELSGEVARAREAWHEALLERGILPFLREALADPGTSAALHSTTTASTSRMPRLGYDQPGFRSPDDGAAPGPRPSFTSPDYTSPDFGGPEHQPE